MPFHITFLWQYSLGQKNFKEIPFSTSSSCPAQKSCKMSLECVTMFAPTPFIEKGNRIVLGADPKGKNFLYASTKTIVIRDVANPKNCDVYTEHSKNTTVAKYSKSGYYICSADITGRIRIWDTVNADHKLKSEFHLLPGEITDLQWDPDSKRIAVCGKGGSVFAKVIMWDSGNTVGNLDNIAGGSNSIAYRPTRPFRIAIGSEFNELVFYEGPPFKFSKTSHVHKTYVQSVRFSPNGAHLASACMHGRLFLSDGKTCEEQGEFCDGEKAHSGGINAISWSPNSKELLTASGDKSSKIWDVEKKEVVAKFAMGTEDQDQQVSCLWIDNYLLSVSLSGDINYLNRDDPTKPSKVIHGHNRSISSISVLDKETFFTGDIMGKILKWDTETAVASMFSGKGHKGKIIGLHCDQENNKLVSVGWDDQIRFTSLSSMDYSTSVTKSVEGQPRQLSVAGNGYYAVLTNKRICLFKDEKEVFTLDHESEDFNFTPDAFAAACGRVAIEHSKGRVKIYSIENDALVESAEFGTVSNVTMMAFTRCGSKLAVVCAKIIQIFEVADNFKNCKKFEKHNGNIKAIGWSPSGKFLASSGMDNQLYVWDTPNTYAEVASPHKEYVNAIAWLDEDRLISCGSDCFSKLWRVEW